jgi:hypothetical protein
MDTKGPSVTRTYNTTFKFEHIIDILEKEKIDFKESVKGRIFFRIPNFEQTCIEFCRGGKLMLKGGPCLQDGLHDDRIISRLFKLQCKHFPSTIAASYKLSSVHASRKWFRDILSECVEILANKKYTETDKITNEVMQNIYFLADTKKRKGKKLEDDAVSFKLIRLQHFFRLLLTGEKDTEFTPFKFVDAFKISDEHVMAVLDPKTDLTKKECQGIAYLFNARTPEIKPPGLVKSINSIPDGWYTTLVFYRQPHGIEEKLLKE